MPEETTDAGNNPITQQVLNDFITTIDESKDLSDKDLFTKFPEFGGDEKKLQSAKDYYTTFYAGDHKSPEEINSKFPEFFGEKKSSDQTGTSLSEDGGNLGPVEAPSTTSSPYAPVVSINKFAPEGSIPPVTEQPVTQPMTGPKNVGLSGGQSKPEELFNFIAPKESTDVKPIQMTPAQEGEKDMSYAGLIGTGINALAGWGWKALAGYAGLMSKALGGAGGEFEMMRGEMLSKEEEGKKAIEDIFPEIPKTRTGEIAKGMVEGAPVIMMSMAPPLRFATVFGEMAVPSIVLGTGATKGLESAGAGGTTGEVISSTAEGMLEGGEMHSLGLVGGSIGKGIGSLTKAVSSAEGRAAVEKSAEAVSTALLFGGNDAVKQYVTTGKVDWNAVQNNIGVGFGMGLFGAAGAVKDYAVKKANQNFFGTTPELASRLAASKESVENLRKKALDHWAKAHEHYAKGEIEKANAYLAAGTALANMADIKAVGDGILKDPVSALEKIDKDNNLSDQEKKALKKKIRDFVKQSDPRMVEAEKLAKAITEKEKEHRALVEQDVEMHPLIKEAKTKDIAAQIDVMKSNLSSLFEKPADVEMGMVPIAESTPAKSKKTFKEKTIDFLDKILGYEDEAAAKSDAGTSQKTVRKGGGAELKKIFEEEVPGPTMEWQIAEKSAIQKINDWFLADNVIDPTVKEALKEEAISIVKEKFVTEKQGKGEKGKGPTIENIDRELSTLTEIKPFEGDLSETNPTRLVGKEVLDIFEKIHDDKPGLTPSDLKKVDDFVVKAYEELLKNKALSIEERKHTLETLGGIHDAMWEYNDKHLTNDSKNEPRLPSEVGGREKPKQAEPDQGAGDKKTEDGGVVQTPQEVTNLSSLTDEQLAEQKLALDKQVDEKDKLSDDEFKKYTAIIEEQKKRDKAKVSEQAQKQIDVLSPLLQDPNITPTQKKFIEDQIANAKKELLGEKVEPKEEAPKEEAPKEEAPKEEAPKEEAPKEEAPEGEPIPPNENFKKIDVLSSALEGRTTEEGKKKIQDRIDALRETMTAEELFVEDNLERIKKQLKDKKLLESPC